MDGPGDQHKHIASGPFMLGKPWRYRHAIYLVPNPHWYEAAKMKLKEIDYIAFSSQAASYQAYLAGEVMQSGVPSSAMASARNRPDFHSAPQLDVDYLTPNLGPTGRCKPAGCQPFNDVHFRRAPLVEAALKAWTAVRLERAMAQLAEALFDSRRQSDLATVIVQRMLLSLAVNARRGG